MRPAQHGSQKAKTVGEKRKHPTRCRKMRASRFHLCRQTAKCSREWLTIMSDAAALARAAEFAAFNGQLDDAQQLLERCTDSLPQEPAAEVRWRWRAPNLPFSGQTMPRLLHLPTAQPRDSCSLAMPRANCGRWSCTRASGHGMVRKSVQRRCEQLIERWRARTGERGCRRSGSMSHPHYLHARTPVSIRGWYCDR